MVCMYAYVYVCKQTMELTMFWYAIQLHRSHNYTTTYSNSLKNLQTYLNRTLVIVKSIGHKGPILTFLQACILIQ